MIEEKEPPVLKICLYADDRTDECIEIVKYLMKERVIFFTIPTTGATPYVVFGVARYTGIEGIKKLVERLRSEEFYKHVKYLPTLTDEELADCLTNMIKEAKKKV